MNHVTVALASFAVISSTACGAMFNGTRQTIQATSAPDAARITTTPATGEYTTPASISLQRKQGYSLTFTKEGYTPATFEIQNKMQGGILALDILFTGLIGVIIDGATGAWYKLSPETAVVAMSRTSAMVDGPEKIEIVIRIGQSDKDREQPLRVESSANGVMMNVRVR